MIRPLLCLAASLLVMFAAVAATRTFVEKNNAERAADVTQLAETLESAGEMHPVLGALVPALELPLDGKFLFRVTDGSGALLAGNIAEVPEPVVELARGETGRFLVAADGDSREVVGLVIDLEQAATVFIGRPVYRLSALALLFLSLSTIGCLALVSGLAYRDVLTGARHRREIEDILNWLENTIMDRVTPESQMPASISSSLASSAERARRIFSRLERKNDEQKKLSQYLRHEVLQKLKRALNIFDRPFSEEDIEQAALQLDFVARNCAGLLELNEIGAELRDRFEPVDLAQLVSDRLEEYRVVAQARDVTLELTQLVGGNAYALGAEHHIGLLFSNLLENAVQYTAPGSKVAVSLNVGRNGEPIIEILDAGPGFAGFPADFDPGKGPAKVGQRGSAGHAREGSSGIGLSIVYQEVQLLGASLLLEDAFPKRTPPGLRVRLQFKTPSETYGSETAVKAVNRTR